MSAQVDMVNDVQVTFKVDPMDPGLLRWLDDLRASQQFSLDASEPGPATWAAAGSDVDKAQAQATHPTFQFRCPKEERTDEFIAPAPEPSTQSWYPEDGVTEWGGTDSENGGPTPSASSSSTGPGSMSGIWYGPTPPVYDTPSTGMVSGMDIDGSSVAERLMMTGLETTPELSRGDNGVFQPQVVSQPSGSQTVRPFLQVAIVLSIRLLTFPAAAANQKPAGWTYKQILEMVAFPPRDTPHLWKDKVSQLADDLGMSKGSTGSEIITFVINFAKVKNELQQVAPLVRALAGAARLVEGRDVVPEDLRPLIANFYPGVARMLGFLGSDGGSPNTEPQDFGHVSCNISLAPSEEQQIQDFPMSQDESDDEEDAEDEPVRERHRVSEEDLYCRIGTCPMSFKDPHVCAKHRRRHFPQIWKCPGPCRDRTEKGGKYARKETLKRHLTFDKFAECKEAALRAADLKSIPASTNAWLDRFRDGPECPWQCPEYQMTDLATVKERLRDPNYRAPPAEHIPGRHRY